MFHQLFHTVNFRQRKQLVARGKRSRGGKKEAKRSFAIIYFSFDTIDAKLHCSQLQHLRGTILGYNEEVCKWDGCKWELFLGSLWK